MTEPISLAVIGGIALTEGIKFLYNQAGEVLKRWRERKQAPVEAANKTETVAVALPDVIEGERSSDLTIHFETVEELEEQLRALRRDLADSAQDIEPVDAADEHLLKRVEALRRLLEAVFQQRLTFKGERRAPSGPILDASINVKEVAGYAAAVRAEEISRGSVTAEAKADRVEEGGQIVSVDVQKIGGPN